MKKSPFFILIALLAFSCENEPAFELQNTDYLIFGWYAGECAGDCIAAFRVSNQSLEEDTTTRFYRQDYTFQAGRVLDNDAWSRASTLISSLPTDLIQSGTDIYGCPDCADQGGIFLIFNQAGQTRTILLDTVDTDDQPTSIINFKDQMSALIQEFSE